MKTNKVEDFLTFIADHLTFAVSEIIHFDIPKGGISEAEYLSKGEKIKFIKCKNLKLHEFENQLAGKLKDGILYLQIQFAKHKDAAIVIFKDSISQAKILEGEYLEIDFNGEKYTWRKGIKIYDEINSIEVSIDGVNDFYYKQISPYLEIQKQALNDLFSAYVNVTTLLTGTPSVFKLTTNLTKAELVLLIRLLDDDGKGIFVRKHQTEIFRMIANSFSTENKDNLTFDGIKKAYYNIDDTTIDKISQLLYNARQRLNKLKENFNK